MTAHESDFDDGVLRAREDRISELLNEIERLRADGESLWQDVQRADGANKELCDEIERLKKIQAECHRILNTAGVPGNRGEGDGLPDRIRRALEGR